MLLAVFLVAVQQLANISVRSSLLADLEALLLLWTVCFEPVELLPLLLSRMAHVEVFGLMHSSPSIAIVAD